MRSVTQTTLGKRSLLGGRAAQRLACAWVLSAVACLSAGAISGCDGLRPAVSMSIKPHEKTPLDASVWIDEEFIGFLGYVAAHGVRLPEGEHRITVEREGYLPWDRLVVSDREPIHLDVRLIPIPD